MKKYIRLFVSVLLILSIFFCAAGCNTLKPSEVEFSARYFRRYFNLGDDGVAVFCSREQLEEFAAEYEHDPYMIGCVEYFLNDNAYELAQKGTTKGQRPVRKASIFDFFEEYTDGFFEDHYLVLISRQFDRYDDAFRVDNIEATEDNKLSVALSWIWPYEYINYETGEFNGGIAHPSTGNWSFLLELKREIGIASEDKVVINIDWELDIYKDVYFHRYD